ncbi:hypothetical protein COY23_03835 [bacterium (Candidatus Torokbacteria) CG_4_10_14_0_2_um_filter_35_8]|nr:MAG: hypothetical protein COY23_03835 [bacterium (Candidatus Torokbacteria) CG_4_10_14_0_2_um_filter_35_8]
MSREPKVDRVKFQEELRQYFRDVPISPFTVFDNGRIHLEQPENYGLYTDISGIDTLVVKVGTSILTHKDYKRMIYNMNCLSEDLTRLKEERGLNILLVSSGAIGLGRKARLRRGERIPEKEKYTPEQKRTDAIEGQTLLYELWRHHFYPQLVDESLVTHEDITDPQKNAKLLKKYQRWLSEGKIPVINEDDAKSLEEIDISLKGERAFRDNDGLASLHAQFLKREGYNPLLVLLSNTDGIYTAESFRNGEYTPIRIVKASTALEEQALPVSSTRGRGGVISKIEASRDAVLDDIYVVIANGQFCNHDSSYQKKREDSQRRYDALDSVLDGRVVGTRFLPRNYMLRGKCLK